MYPIYYSSIPAAERADWSDGDLSVAIWDEAVHLAGGDSFQPENVAKLPPGFRAVLAEGRVRAHVDNDGLPTAVWNDDGVANFEIARDSYTAMGMSDVAHTLQEVIHTVQAWQASAGQTPRALDYNDFVSSPLGRKLRELSDPFGEITHNAFPQMMKFLRENANWFE